jgi:hypothetical protein
MLGLPIQAARIKALRLRSYDAAAVLGGPSVRAAFGGYPMRPHGIWSWHYRGVRLYASMTAALTLKGAKLDSTLIVLGALAALVGLYFQFAPSDWWLAHFSEAYQFGSYTLGGLILGAGFGVFADRAFKEDGHPSARSETGIGLALLAIVGALTAVLFWIS